MTDYEKADRMLLKKMDKARVMRIFMYGALVPSGVFAFLDPSKLVTEQVSYIVANAWAVCMVVSAGICLYGAITDKWIGEFTGLPLLVAVVALYGGSSILSYNEGKFILIAYGLTMVAFACGLLARWNDVRKIRANAAVEGGSFGGTIEGGK